MSKTQVKISRIKHEDLRFNLQAELPIARHMRTKVKYALPLGQIGVALILLHQAKLWIILTRQDDMPGPGPAAILLGLINLPVALLRGVWFRCFDVFWPDWIFVVALAPFWYCVGRALESRLERRAQIAVKAQLGRIVMDLLFLVSSVLYLWSHPDVRCFSWPYFLPSLWFLLVWILAPPVLLAVDVFLMARRK